MVVTQCKWCGQTITRRGSKPGVFCSLNCKASWQRTQKPVDEQWLREKYIEQGMGTYQIARLVGRNAKQVWHWLRGYGIPIRHRAWSNQPHADEKSYQNADWLRWHYILCGESSSEIAEQCGATPANIIHFLRKFDIPRRTTSEVRALKHWGVSGEDNPMYGIGGELHPGWKGGCTPERQACYSSAEWFRACAKVRKRDSHRCQRCGSAESLHIHHITSFAVKELRTEPSNLVLLCATCHRWVHSPENTDKEYIKEWKEVSAGESCQAVHSQCERT